jgi:hypothetical protein
MGSHKWRQVLKREFSSSSQGLMVLLIDVIPMAHLGR